MTRGIFSLTQCAVWASLAAAASAALLSSGEDTDSRQTHEEISELPYNELPQEEPADTIEAATAGAGHRLEPTSLQDRLEPDPFDPTVVPPQEPLPLHVNDSSTYTPSGSFSKYKTIGIASNEDPQKKTTWFGKSTRCTVNATESTSTARAPASAGSASGQAFDDDKQSDPQTGDGSTSTPKPLKETHGTYARAHSGPPEDHYVDDQ